MPAGSRIGRSTVVLSWVFLASLAVPAPPSESSPAPTSPPSAARDIPSPQVFEVNRGQAEAAAAFVSRAAGLFMKVDPTGIDLDGLERSARLVFRGASPSTGIAGLEALSGRVTYLGGPEGVATFAAVRYTALYPGIDLTVRGDHRRLFLDFDVAPDAEAGTIDVAIEGDDSGDLRLHRSTGRRSVRVTLERGQAEGANGIARMPVDGIARVAVDEKGNTFVAGRTVAGASASREAAAPAAEAFVARIDKGSTTPAFVTYFGGSGRDVPLALAIAPDGTIVVAGRTESPDFPLAGTLRGPADGFVLRLTPDGSLLTSDLFGGPGDDEARAVAIDSRGEVLVGGTGFLVALDGARPIPTGPAGLVEVDALAFDAAGRLFAAGSRRVGDLREAFVAPAATFVPVAIEGEAVTALAFDAAGTLYAAGRRNESGAGFVALLDIEAATVRTVRDLDATPLAIAPSGEGHAWIVGARGQETARRSFIARVSGADAGIDRLRPIPPSSMTRATGIALDPDGRPIAAGFEDGDGDTLSARMIAAAPSGLVSVRPLADVTIGALAAGCPGTIRFDNSAGTGLWQTATNWNTDILPGAADDVCIPAGMTVTLGSGTQTVSTLFVETGGSLTVSGGSLSLAAASQVDGTLSFSSGTITGTGTLTIATVFNWSGGLMTAAGITNANGGINISGATSKDLTFRTLNTGGTVTWTGIGQIRMGGGAAIHNLGTWDAQTNSSITNALGGVNSFDNQATRTFRKTVGTGITAIDVPFTNDGAVSIEAGTLALSLGGTASGSFTGLAGTTLRFAGGAIGLGATSSVNVPNVAVTTGTVTVDGTFNAATSTSISNGTWTFNAAATLSALGTASGLTISGGTLVLNSGEAVALPSLTMSGGSLQGSDNVTVPTMSWSGGSMTGSGTTSVAGPLSITAATAKDLNIGRILAVSGTTSWSGTGTIRMGGGAILRNSGSFEALVDANIDYALGGAIPFFENLATGSFTKKTATGVTSIDAGFTNNGAVSIEAGTLSFSGGGSASGSFTGLPGTTLRFAGGTMAFGAASSVNVPNVAMTSGTVTVDGAFSAATSTSLSNGTWTFNPAATLSAFGTASGLTLSSGTLNLNSGEAVALPSLTMSGGILQGSDGVTASTMSWSGGSMNGTGTTSVTGPVSITTATAKDLNIGRILAVSGTTSWSGTGTIRMGGGAIFRNSGSFEAIVDANMDHALGGAAPLFENLAAGSFTKKTATGVTAFNVPLTNSGTMSIETGTLTLTRNGTLNTGITGSAGTTLRFAGGSSATVTGASLNVPNIVMASGSLDVSGPYTASTGTTISGGTMTILAPSTSPALGALAVSGGTLDLQSGEALTVPTLALSGGRIQGTDALGISGLTDWSAGAMGGSGSTSTNGGLTIGGGGTKDLDGRVLNTAGATTWSGSGTVRTGQGAVIHNSGTWSVPIDVQMTIGLGGTARFDNQPGATFRKTAGVGTTDLRVVFDNAGTLDFQSGTLLLAGGGTTTGTITGAAGTILRTFGSVYECAPGSSVSIASLLGDGDLTVRGSFVAATGTTINQGTITFLPESTLTGLGPALVITGGALDLRSGEAVPASTLAMSGGSLKGTDTVNLSGGMTWSSGTLTEAGILNANGGVTFSGLNAKDITSGRVLNLAGTSTVTGAGPIRISTGGVVHNAGTLDFQTNTDIQNVLGGTGTLDNQATGSFLRTAGAGLSTISVNVTNAGTMRLQAGSTTIPISGSLTQTAGLLSVEAGTLTVGGGLPIQGGTLGGTGTVAANVTLGSNTHLAPGTSPGSLAINGTLAESATSSFEVEIGGLTPGTQHDRVVMSAATTIAGTLNVSLVNGFVPADLDTFTILTFPSATGTFSTVNFPPLPGGLVWQIFYTPTTVFLKVISDLDGDGVSNLVDCAPNDATAWAVPAEVTNVQLGTNNQTVSWGSLATQAGPATIYDLMRGLISQLPTGNKPAETCLAPDSGSTQFLDNTTPAIGAGFYYLVRGSNVCGVGTYGTTSAGAPRNTASCP